MIRLKPKSTRSPSKAQSGGNVKDAIFASVQTSSPAEESDEVLVKKVDDEY